MYHKINLTLTILGLLILSAGSVLAQGSSGNHGDQQDALRAELERTDQLIEQAREAVQASQAPVAQMNLNAAIDFQTQAWNQFEKNNLQIALSLTRQASERAKKAIAAGRMSEQGEHVVQAKLERTNEMLERARELLVNQDDSHYRAILESARDNLDKAWEFYRSGQYRAALMLANQAEKALDKLIRTSDRDNRNQLNYERRVEAAQQSLERLRSAIADCESANAQQLAQHASEAFERANNFAATDKFQAAIQALQQSRKMANQALQECRGDDALVSRHEKLNNEIDRLAENVASSDDRGQKFLEMAAEQLRLAQEAFDNDRPETAAAALKACEMTLSQLKRHLENL
jgi:RNA binding exosome subunit